MDRLKLFNPFYEAKDFSSGGWDGSQPALWSPANLLNIIDTGGTADRERIENNFDSYVANAYKANGVIFACIQARQLAFAEAKFKWRKNQQEGRHGDMYTNGKLALLNRPWPSGTTGELLSRMEQDASLAGNSFWTVADDHGRVGRTARSGEGARMVHLRPDWCELVIGQKGKSESHSDPFAVDAKVLGLWYRPEAGSMLGDTLSAFSRPVFLVPGDFVHYSPTPDPIARFRGMSWLTPVINEIQADSSATQHKKKFFENAAVPNMVVRFDRDTSTDAFTEFVEQFKESHQGEWNAYKTLFLMGGADVTPLSHNFRELEFTATQGKGESRIAMAAGVPGQWLGSSEGMQSSSLAGNSLPAARRKFADGLIRPLWRIASASLESILDVPVDAHLWFDEEGIAFLREDAQDRAQIVSTEMAAINVAIMAGFEPDAAVDAVRAQDVGRLVGSHTGLVSVQMQAFQDANERDTRLDATAVSTLIQTGFTPESVVDAVWNNDLTKLVKDPKAMANVVESLSGGGGFGNPSGGGAKPGSSGGDKPASDKPAADRTDTGKSHDPRAGDPNGQ
jgi:phage portal protein BeeE